MAYLPVTDESSSRAGRLCSQFSSMIHRDERGAAGGYEMNPREHRPFSEAEPASAEYPPDLA